MTKLVSTKKIQSFEKGPVRRSLFRNGAVSLFHQFKTMESACVNLYFLAGSIFEKPEQEGLAHVIEHMLFKEESARKLVREMEDDGADINAYTYKEYVCFELDCAADFLPKFLPKFLSLFLNPKFKKEDLELEKKVILQELREDKDDHETEGVEYLYKKNFDRSLGHSIGGSSKTVGSFTVKDLESFYKKFYRPERMVLSIVSGKRFDSLEKVVEGAFSDETSRQSSALKRPYRLKCSKKFSKLNHVKTRLKRSMESAIAMYSFDGASIFHPDYYSFLVLDEYLMGGMSSKFFIELREKNAYVYGMGSALNSYAKEGSYMMIFHCLKKNIPSLKKVVAAVMEELAQKGFDEQELDSIKKRVVMGWKLGFDSMLERNEFIAEIEMLGEEDFGLKRQEAALEKVNAKSLQKLVRKLSNGEHSSLIMSS